MSSTREIKVTVTSPARDGREPETAQGVVAKHDFDLACDQAELEEAIAFLQIRVNDIKERRALLSRIGADIELVEVCQ